MPRYRRTLSNIVALPLQADGCRLMRVGLGDLAVAFGIEQWERGRADDKSHRPESESECGEQATDVAFAADSALP